MPLLTRVLIHWAAISASLWAASQIFAGIRFADTRALIISALVLGLVNALVRPVLVLLTLPITILTLGLFLLVLNALMLLLVSRLVDGFTVAGFWTAFFAGIFISVLSFVVGALLQGGASSA